MANTAVIPVIFVSMMTSSAAARARNHRHYMLTDASFPQTYGCCREFRRPLPGSPNHLAAESSSMRGANCWVSTGPSVAVLSISTSTTSSIRRSIRRWPAGSKVLKATSVAASVAATCGKVSDHMVSRAAGVYLNARPAHAAASPLPATSATMIAATSEKLSRMLWTKTSGSIGTRSQ